eukprot:SAG31_NODE_9039_length_1344_cov_1.400803_3_plen_204_part_00
MWLPATVAPLLAAGVMPIVSGGGNPPFHIGGFRAPSLGGFDKPLANLTHAQVEAWWAGEKAALEDYAAAGFTFIDQGPFCPGNDDPNAKIGCLGNPPALGPHCRLEGASRTAAETACLTRYLELCKSVGISTYLTPPWAAGTASDVEKGDVLVGYVRSPPPSQTSPPTPAHLPPHHGIAGALNTSDQRNSCGSARIRTSRTSR